MPNRGAVFKGCGFLFRHIFLVYASLGVVFIAVREAIWALGNPLEYDSGVLGFTFFVLEYLLFIPGWIVTELGVGQDMYVANFIVLGALELAVLMALRRSLSDRREGKQSEQKK